MLKLSLVTLFVALLAPLTLASPAAAMDTICDGDCSMLGPAPDRGDGSLFAFELGLKPDTDDLKLKVVTKGNVYLMGPISTERGAKLKAARIILDGDMDHIGRVKLKESDRLRMPELKRPNSRQRGKLPKAKIVSKGDVYLDVTGVDLRKLRVKAKGMIILSDQPMLSATPVPEPGAALLMGLGLVGLGVAARRVSA